MVNDMRDMDDEDCPCKECEAIGWFCDEWEMQYCCELCRWLSDDEEPIYCDECDPMDI